jgi:AcrR family transcriptional regulator
MQTTATPKRNSRSSKTRARILAAAKRLFSAKGYDRTTIRSVAAAADIHASMVIRYFETKEDLFWAAVTFDLRLPNLTRTPKSELGIALVRHFLDRWEGQMAGDELPSLLRAAVTHPEARKRMIQIYERQVAPSIKRLCSPSDSRECAALIATQLLGLAYTRYVLKIPSVTRLPHEAILCRVGATLQSYLTGP